MRKICIGTSGWTYPHWKGNFYPQGLAQKDWLEFYCQKFNSVEVNYSFYRQPKTETFKKWQSEVPKNFVFSIKGNRFITHIKRLKDCQEPLKSFFKSADALVAKKTKRRNVVLWQLPPSLKKDIPGLEGFLKLLPKSFRHAFEFRHISWLDKEVLDFIHNYKTVEVAVVIQDWPDWPVIRKPIGSFALDEVASFAYLRFHGKKQLYSSDYSKKDLEEWAKKMREWSDRGFDIYAYFNNDALGHAPKNASQLKKLIT